MSVSITPKSSSSTLSVEQYNNDLISPIRSRDLIISSLAIAFISSLSFMGIAVIWSKGSLFLQLCAPFLTALCLAIVIGCLCMNLFLRCFYASSPKKVQEPLKESKTLPFFSQEQQETQTLTSSPKVDDIAENTQENMYFLSSLSQLKQQCENYRQTMEKHILSSTTLLEKVHEETKSLQQEFLQLPILPSEEEFKKSLFSLANAFHKTNSLLKEVKRVNTTLQLNLKQLHTLSTVITQTNEALISAQAHTENLKELLFYNKELLNISLEQESRVSCQLSQIQNLLTQTQTDLESIQFIVLEKLTTTSPTETTPPEKTLLPRSRSSFF